MEKNKKKIGKEIEKYMKLPYTIELIPEEDGTYFVKVKELPGCMSTGDTAEEAVELIHEAMRGWFESTISRGLKVPLPDKAKKYSGKFVVRVPKHLHQKLAEQAKNESISLNQLIVSLLSENLTATILTKKIEKLEIKIEAMQKNKASANELAGEYRNKIIEVNWEESDEKIYKH